MHTTDIWNKNLNGLLAERQLDKKAQIMLAGAEIIFTNESDSFENFNFIKIFNEAYLYWTYFVSQVDLADILVDGVGRASENQK